jgi:hypothetical protein
MSRKVKTFTVSADGRDKGKVFILTEMSATHAERWAVRAFLGLAKHGIDIPEGMQRLGMVGIATYGIGLLGQLPYEDAVVLMDDMFTCVKYQPGADPNVVRELVEDDIEEVATRMELRKEVFSLHVDFTKGAKTLT